MHIAVIIAVMVIAGCRLDPLVDDTPGASVHLLPSGSTVPSIATNSELANQIRFNDGLDDAALTSSNGVIVRGTGVSNNTNVRYWSFGPATRAPSPLYEFIDAAGASIGHPAMVDSLPGDRGYNPLRTLVQVKVTGAYAGQLITTPEALADAVDLGLVEEPRPTGLFVAAPIVPDGTRLEVKTGAAADAEVVYARGYTVAMFRLGTRYGEQPGAGLVPTRWVSFLREPGQISFNPSLPIFEARIPATAPDKTANYSALSLVVNVDLAPGAPASQVSSDDDLYVRDAMGVVTATTSKVAHFEITGANLLLPLQFEDGKP